MLVVVAFAVIGYAVAFLPARYTHLDIGRFRRSVWWGVGYRDRWLWAVRISYLALGWPSLVVAAVWWTSRTRKVLVEIREQLHS